MKGSLSVGKGVQFNGPDQVMQAYSSRELPAFALWCGKQLLFTYEDDDIETGEELLKKWLDNLKESAATYTVTVYKKVPDDGITAQTPYHGSFNFKLQEKPVSYMGEAYNQSGGNWKFTVDELNRLRLENAELKEENEELQAELDELQKEVNKGVLGKLGNVVTGMVDNEIVQNALADGIANWIGRLINPVAAAAPKALAGNDPVQWQMKVTPENAQSVNDSLSVLFAVDGLDVPTVLAMLANMAKKDPQQFLQYVNMLAAINK